MAQEDLLIDFLLLLALLFFLPRVIDRAYKIPHPLIEVVLGATAALFAPAYFSGNAIIPIIAALGIITLFVYAGLEADVTFIRKEKRVFLENLAIHLLFFGLVGVATHALTSLTWQASLLVSLALTTPSASYIFSTTKALATRDRTWIEGKALAAEIMAILLLALLLGIDSARELAIAFGTLVGLVFILPLLLAWLYKHLVSRVIGSEFPFILVVALFAAYVTEQVGMHFLVGAFVAGLVAKRFITGVAHDRAYSHVTHERAKEIMEGFGFFSATFAPFYFFSTGLTLTRDLLTSTAIFVALAVFALVCAARVGFMTTHRKVRIVERPTTGLRISLMLLPTLVFTFVTAQILHDQFAISDTLFAVLLLYGILTAIVPIIALRLMKTS